MAAMRRHHVYSLLLVTMHYGMVAKRLESRLLGPMPRNGRSISDKILLTNNNIQRGPTMAALTNAVTLTIQSTHLDGTTITVA